MHSQLLMLSCRVYIFLHNSERTMPEDRRQGCEVNTGLGHLGGESMPEVVENEMERSSSFLFRTRCVVGTVHSQDVPTRFPIGRENPVRRVLAPSCQDTKALSGEGK